MDTICHVKFSTAFLFDREAILDQAKNVSVCPVHKLSSGARSSLSVRQCGRKHSAFEFNRLLGLGMGDEDALSSYKRKNYYYYYSFSTWKELKMHRVF